MTTSFTKRISLFITSVFDNSVYRKIKKEEFLSRMLIFTGLLSTHCLYALSTEKKELIYVVKKYKMVRNGFTEFMVIDEKGRHLNVNNSLWYWKWDSIEEWYKIEPNKNFFIKYYGWRVPLFGLFPNIVTTDNENFLNPNKTKKIDLFENTKIAKFQLINSVNHE
jgi:hypothetical protein